MASWLPLALLAALLYGAQNAFSRAATKGATDELATIALEFASAVIVLGFALVRGRPLKSDAPSIAWAIAAGIAVGFGTIIYFALLRRGAGLSAMAPVVLAGSAIVTAVAGYVWFGEKISIGRGVGIVLAVAGIVLLSRK